MFQEVPSGAVFPKLEEQVLDFWKRADIYEESLRRRKDAPSFVFYEGPPTANGMPHPGHCLTRAIKDLFPRYRTMRGYRCERKAGWDTHGLPVEVEVCKELGIHAKEEIESYGVEPFIHRCQESVWRYMQEWERLTERLGFWIHTEGAYVTYHQSYVESVWWCLKNLFDRGLLYQGHKIVWWWAQGGTALSSGEVGQGYREVADPSVYVLFPLLDDRDVRGVGDGDGVETDTSLLVWTTTPWTLPSNQFAAVHPELEYATVVDSETGQRLILAAALVETIAGKAKRELSVESTCRGSELVGRRYKPPFAYYYDMPMDDPVGGESKTWGEIRGELKSGGVEHEAWRVVAADFVTIDSGTGVVHQAPAFGEVDYDVLIAQQERFIEGHGASLICAVAADGKFTEDAPEYEGRWVKDADRDIVRDLKDRGLLYHREQYLHDYPFCWRAEEDPLIQYPRQSWFVRTTAFKDAMLANNAKINWLPEHIKDGRFGNFLESNVDWALSRERYWGTPLPIWVCQETGRMEAIGSYEELLAKPGVAGAEVWEQAKAAKPDLPDDLRVHKPYIDEITYDSPFTAGARMRRVTEVIDCWFDSGAMPFAQWGYPHQGRDEFEAQFPADFISEALDQTRGWFYSLLAISTLLFSGDGEQEAGSGGPGTGNGEGGAAGSPTALAHEYPHPYRNCIVLGLMLGEDGAKMSKSKRNYREPREIFDKYGADAMRWYFFANQPPWTTIRYSEQAIKDSISEFILRLWNVYSFFVTYARTSGFDPSKLLEGEAGQISAEVLRRARGYRPVAERRELDRWVMSELHATCAAVTERMDAYDNFAACQKLHAFVDNLSNWYVRRSRDQFWRNWKTTDSDREVHDLEPEMIDRLDDDSRTKLDAYFTLYECLLTTLNLAAPFVPFVTETMWRNLAGVFGDRALASVHLCDFPAAEESLIDRELSERMDLGRLISSLGLQARAQAKLKVRQPLSRVEVILADTTHQPWLESHRAVVAEELNVKEVEFTDQPEKYVTHQVLPNFKLLGPRLGKLMPKLKKALNEQSGSELLANIRDNGKINLTLDGTDVELGEGEVEVRISAKDGWTAANDRGCVVVLSTEITPELKREGIAKDVVRVVQDFRKSRDFDYSDRIELGIVPTTEEIGQAIQEHAEFIQGETLATRLQLGELEGEGVDRHEAEQFGVRIYVRRLT